MDKIDVGRRSIQRRIITVFFATTGLALTLTATALFATAFLQFRQDLGANLQALAQVTGANSGASLIFDDADAAMDTLRVLKDVASIEAALIYDADGEIFARYVRSDVQNFSAPEELVFEPSWSRDHISFASEIKIGDEQIGVVFLRSDIQDVITFLMTSAGIVGGVLLISFFLCWFGAARLRHSIAHPLELLVEGSVSMSEGDLSTQVDVPGEDEMSVLAVAFNAMVDSLRGLVSQIGHNTGHVADAVATLNSAASSLREGAQRQEVAVESSAESLGGIIASMRAVNTSVEALSGTALETSSAANEMDASIAETGTHIDELSEVIDSTASSVVEMTSGIREIARSADALNHSTDSTAQALELLSDSVRSVESNATESHVLSEETSSKAEQGVAAVDSTVGGMVEIQDSFKGIESIIENLSEKSDSIGAVVKVIESVVEQTNLLALNAAIISSQAGEHGRAFSVVADEVRNLAERTSSSTREIADLIDGVQGGVQNAVSAMERGAMRVDRGVDLANSAGRILREIGESSHQSTRWAKEIVQATRSQTADIDQVGIAMSQVKDIATQLGRGTHEQDSASVEITRGVDQMRHLGLEVKSAAQEQRRESGLITESVEVVASKIREISVETKDQSKRADQIQEALEVFREVTLQASKRAEDTSETVRGLSAHAEELELEIGRFRL